ncbi:DUF4935 domain-containing protein [Stenotrophomonas maltophilia]|nr:DUF4935 domain-containing protein [Stenotrophomonas maltophilia]
MPQMHLFIDTNVFLNYYRHTADDTKALDQLCKHVEAGDIALHLPLQVRDEWIRNRERGLHESNESFRRVVPPGLPRHLDGLDSTLKYLEAVTALMTARDQLMIEANSKALQFDLAVDKSLNRVFSSATLYADDNAIFEMAKSRADKGNPPGKRDSYGDQYNWEILLQKVPDEDLYVVSKDSDFASALAKPDKNGAISAHDFLKREWSERKSKKNLYVFQTIATLLKFYENAVAVPAAVEGIGASVQSPDTSTPTGSVSSAVVAPPTAEAEPAVATPVAPPIEDAGEEEQARIAAVGALVTSSNFQQTHVAIAELMKIRASLTIDDAHKLANAALDNKQIEWILTDSDVRDFYLWLLESFTQTLDPGLFDALVDALGLTPDPEDDDPWAHA